MTGGASYTGPDAFLEKMAGSAVQEVEVAGELLRPGSRVRLRPRPGGDIMDLALAGRVAVIEGIDEDDAGAAHVAVVVEDDPGRDLGEAHHPAHRFFFSPGELEPVPPVEASLSRRVLVAGIGNIFLGDDGFGVAVARQLAGCPLPRGTELCDYGIRGLDLAYALVSGYDAAILVDLVPRGGTPGSIYVNEPDAAGAEGEAPVLDSHQMNPLAVLALARQLGSLPPQLLIVGCEPERGGTDSMSMEMNPAVAAAVEPAAGMVVRIAQRLAQEPIPGASTGSGKERS